MRIQKVGPAQPGQTVGMSRFFGVGAVGLLTYIGEYASYIVVLAFLSDKLVVAFGLGAAGYLIIGTVSGAYLVLSGLVAIPIGHLSDKYGRRRFTMIGCLLGALSLLSLVVIDQITSLSLFAICMGGALIALGGAHGIYTASTLAYTGDIAEHQGDMGKSFGLIEGAEFAGYAFGPALGTTIGFYFGTRGAVFETSAIMLMVAFAIAFAFMPELRRTSIDRVVSHLEHEDSSSNSNADRVPVAEELPGQVEDVHEHSVSWADFLAAFKLPIISVALLTTFVGSIGFSGFFYFVPIYAHVSSGAVPLFALLYGYFSSVMAATAVLLMVPLGSIEDKGKRRMPYLVLGLVLGAASLGLIFFVPPAVLTFVVSSIAFGGSIAMVRVSQLVILAENSSTSNRAAIMGTNHAVEHAGYGVANIVVGTIIAIEAGSFVRGFQALSIILIASGLAFFVYARWKRVR